MSSFKNPSRGYSDSRIDSKQEEIAVIYDNQSWDKGKRTSEDELEYAMLRGMRTIIIEPRPLGHLVVCWINRGNSLNKLSVLSGIGTIVASYFLPQRTYLCYTLGAVNVISAVFYAAAWQFDPCSRYQVDKNYKQREELPLYTLSTEKPVVLERRGTFLMSLTRTTVSVTAVACCVYIALKAYKWLQ